MPKISVITPAYNAAAHIGRTISSVQTQTCADWEHIIIDDGSVDNTREVVDTVRDSRLRFYSQPNQGPGEARNHGIRMSHGEYLIFLDAGDWWDGRCLATLLRCTEQAGPGWISHGDWAFVDSEGNIGKTHCSAFAAGEGLHTLLIYNTMAIHTVLVPHQAIADVGGFMPMRTLEDWHLWLRLARAGYRFTHAHALLAYYHWQPGSRSRNVERRKVERLAMLDHFWAEVAPDDPLQAIHSKSYGIAHVDTCVSYFGQGDLTKALVEFDAAVAHHRPIMATIDTYYRIAYAEQSAHNKATDQLLEKLNETAAASRIEQLMGHIETNYSRDEARTARRAAWAALGLANYHERRHDLARAHLWSAVRADPSSLLDRNVGGTLIRAMLPVSLADGLRALRRSAADAK